VILATSRASINRSGFDRTQYDVFVPLKPPEFEGDHSLGSKSTVRMISLLQFRL
jgi:hypothetical protein